MKQKHAFKKPILRGAMRPLTPPQVDRIGGILNEAGDFRGLALFRMAIDTMFRASDLVALTRYEVTDSAGSVRDELAVVQMKTRNTVKAYLSAETQQAVTKWLATRNSFCGEWLFPGRHAGEHITASQYRRIAKRWFMDARLDDRFYSTHSLRRTKAVLVYAKTQNVEAVRKLLGHSTTQATVRYLGVEDADVAKIAREIKI